MSASVLFIVFLTSAILCVVISSEEKLKPSSNESHRRPEPSSEKAELSPTKLKDLALFKAFIDHDSGSGGNAGHASQASVFFRSQRHRGHHHGGEKATERLSAKEARELFFRGTDRGRLVPLNASQLLPDNCNLHPFDKNVTIEGFESVTVRDHLCYGQCSSLFVPLEDDIIYSCTACLPTEFSSSSVELKPISGSGHWRRIHIKVVKSCGCLSCSTQGMNG